MNNLDQLIRNSINDPWALGNSVLYQLCKDHPYHKADDEIAAKILLIGRVYAASIERRKNKADINDDFYFKVVVPKIKQSGIDSWLLVCKSRKTKEACLSAHKNVTDLFKDISGLEKRSLASKYLHFHLPDMFYIYDSRAATGINKVLVNFGIKRISTIMNENVADRYYAHFYNKCLVVQSKIKENYGKTLDCRQLDTLLVTIANNDLRI